MLLILVLKLVGAYRTDAGADPGDACAGAAGFGVGAGVIVHLHDSYINTQHAECL